VVYIMVDVESDGPFPSNYSMICFGAVPVRESLDQIYFLRSPQIDVRFTRQKRTSISATSTSALCQKQHR
jgi:hypothetical protein